MNRPDLDYQRALGPEARWEYDRAFGKAWAKRPKLGSPQEELWCHERALKEVDSEGDTQTKRLGTPDGSDAFFGRPAEE